VPKTIDNDVRGTDVSIGFATAAQIATELVDRLYSTAESHHRVMVCEVMGRHAGWIGYTAGVATGADVICIPEHAFDPSVVCARVEEVIAVRRPFAIVVVSEGALPLPGTMTVPDYPLDENGFPRLGGMGSLVAERIQAETGFETRVTVLGHVQRGGTPVAADRVLATRLARAAVGEAAEGRWGVVVGARGEDVATTPIEEVASGSHLVPPELWRIPEVLGT
jgi:6-phosphofructokinase 1